MVRVVADVGKLEVIGVTPAGVAVEVLGIAHVFHQSIALVAVLAANVEHLDKRRLQARNLRVPHDVGPERFNLTGFVVAAF